MNNKTILKLTAILTIIFVTACGNKGDLYLPETTVEETEKVEEKQ